MEEIKKLLENDFIRLGLSLGGALGLYLGVVIGYRTAFEIVVTIGARL